MTKMNCMLCLITTNELFLLIHNLKTITSSHDVLFSSLTNKKKDIIIKKKQIFSRYHKNLYAERFYFSNANECFVIMFFSTWKAVNTLYLWKIIFINIYIFRNIMWQIQWRYQLTIKWRWHIIDIYVVSKTLIILHRLYLAWN